MTDLRTEVVNVVSTVFLNGLMLVEDSLLLIHGNNQYSYPLPKYYESMDIYRVTELARKIVDSFSNDIMQHHNDKD